MLKLTRRTALAAGGTLMLGVLARKPAAAQSNDMLPLDLYALQHGPAGPKLPTFDFTTPAGEKKTLADYAGQGIVLNFWATWCAPCVKEIPAFSKVHAERGGQVAFVGLGIDSPEAIRAFDARFKPSYPLVAAGSSGTDLVRAFGNEAGALPYTVVLDAAGHVIASRLGEVDEATLAAWLGPYHGEASSRGAL